MSITELVTPADLSRTRRAKEQRNDYLLFPTDNAGEWTVLHTSGRSYTVTETGRCDCPDSVHRLKGQGQCKHNHLLLSYLARLASEGTVFCGCGARMSIGEECGVCVETLAPVRGNDRRLWE